MAKRLTVSELAAVRAERALNAAVESTLAASDIADRERSGLLMAGSGRLVRKRKHDGVYVSAVKSTLHSTSVTQRPQVQCVPGVEVRAWDAMVRADRALVGMGCRSALVKVVKGQRGPLTATIGAMVAADTAE